MPTYVYECKNNHQTDWTFSFKERPEETQCPVCNQIATPIVASGVSMIFRGTGWTPRHYQ